MRKAEKYRQFAEECRKIAATLSSGEQKVKMLEIAKAWEDCAASVEAEQKRKNA